jgi:hypothetical protein
MAKARIVAVLAVFACCLVVVATAFAVDERRLWAGNKYHLNSGQNGFLNYNVALDESQGEGEDRAVCAGIRGIGETCVGRGSEAVYETVNGIYIEAEPYIHNHDTEAGYFFGWYWGEPL